MFWAAVLLAALVGASVLQYLGPAEHRVPVAAAPPNTAPPAPVVEPAAPPSAPPEPRRTELGKVIADPDPALLEPSPIAPDARMPRVAADGRPSFSVYARATDPADRRPRVALLVVGFGLNVADSSAAIRELPPAVSLGFSPYTVKPDPLLKEARAAGHEFLVTLPMESQGYPMRQSGPHALLTGSDPAANEQNLLWLLSRMQGEVGFTGASDGLRGERFANAKVPFGLVLNELGGRGLLYVDARPGAKLPTANGRVATVSMIVDEPATRADIDTRLQALEQMARDQGAAIGLAGPLRPVTIDRLAAWARTLDARGISLVPVSSLAMRQIP